MRSIDKKNFIDKGKRVAPTLSLFRGDFYNYYKRKKGKIAKCNFISRQGVFNKILRTFFKNLSKNILEKEGGVYLERIGYFCHWMSPNRRVFEAPREGEGLLVLNTHSDRYWYNTSLFTNIVKYPTLPNFTLDRTAAFTIKKGIYREILKGRKYTFHYHALRGLK